MEFIEIESIEKIKPRNQAIPMINVRCISTVLNTKFNCTFSQFWNEKIIVKTKSTIEAAKLIFLKKLRVFQYSFICSVLDS